MAHRTPPQSCVQLLCVCVAAAFLTGCGSEGRRHVLIRAQPRSVRPTAHVWQYLYRYGGEQSGYGTYSYVLVGRDENDETASSLYLELVKAIRGSTASAEDVAGHVPRAQLNVFLIPATGDREAESHEPDYELSKLLLASLSAASPLTFSRPGPYMITLYKPISFGQGDEVANILYFDFTNMPPAAIPEIVRTYKEHILDEDLDGIEKLRSLRLSLLKIALVAEDSIGFAQVAYAALRSAFSG